VSLIEFIKTKPNNEVSVKFSTGSTWLSTSYPNSSCTDETKAVCSELLTNILIRQQLHDTCSYCSTCDFRLQGPEASFLTRLCFSIPLMTIGMSTRSAKTMRRTTLSFAGQIFVWFHVNIQRRRLPVVFFHVVIQPCVTYTADIAPFRGLFRSALPTFCPDLFRTTTLNLQPIPGWNCDRIGPHFLRFCAFAQKMDLKAVKQFTVCEVREKTNTVQQLDVYYHHFLNMFRASLCLSSGDQDVCYCKWCAGFCWMWLVAVVGRCVVGCEHCEESNSNLHSARTLQCSATQPLPTTSSRTSTAHHVQ